MARRVAGFIAAALLFAACGTDDGREAAPPAEDALPFAPTTSTEYIRPSTSTTAEVTTTTAAAPTTTVTEAPPPTTVAPPPAAASRPPAPCHPSYEGECLPPDSPDVDCASGSGNGPDYARGPVRVVGPDVYDLDRDGDGVGCEG